ncbi:P-loop containing nucleoside triphosphate hydrolase protein [Lepidopterella palustris CBS 459.81]|uniref:P-loop containing nucleoside triphosphate hydrolase protein n=1 Tax=Lepidopterella palustris CBS 459.81 TaxID=1314670 RepID=A0A8E2EFD7_9PEZI|nr:P-loop containing nucleoside triphosphate hydrolase protein [Lepidopterella palustris CBS 459.81]
MVATYQGYYLALLGDDGVGKTSFQAKRKLIKVDGESRIIELIDRFGSGVPHNPQWASMYVSSMDCILLLYSTTSATSFARVQEYWFPQICRARMTLNPNLERPNSFMTVVVGTKADLVDKREVSSQAGKDFADSIGCSFFELGFNDDGSTITNLFEHIVRAVDTAKHIQSGALSKAKHARSGTAVKWIKQYNPLKALKNIWTRCRDYLGDIEFFGL